jgi:propionyl-CoA carboxylase alpha chain
VGYESAGTVEFLADNAQNFYFLEMNTRLQVEHPVTEAITGLDLVELMVRVARGERLPAALTGAPLPIMGHAFEARVYAEDPLRGFLPSTGRLSRYVEPQAYGGVDPFLGAGAIRADSGVQQGSEISMFYDPMICKLVTHGADRAAALDLMRAALDAYVIRGVGHNVAFLRDLAAHPRFEAGALTTQFIGEEYPKGFSGVALAPGDALRVAAGAAVMHALREAMFAGLEGAPSPPAAAAAAAAPTRLVVALGATEGAERGPVFDVALERCAAVGGGGRSSWVAEVAPVGGRGAAVRMPLNNVVWAVEDPVLFAELPPEAGQLPSERMLRLQHVARTPNGFQLQFKGAAVNATVRTHAAHALGAHMKPKPKRDTSKTLMSPMPGKLVSVAVKAGDTVELGQELAVVEVSGGGGGGGRGAPSLFQTAHLTRNTKPFRR